MKMRPVKNEAKIDLSGWDSELDLDALKPLVLKAGTKFLRNLLADGPDCALWPARDTEEEPGLSYIEVTLPFGAQGGECYWSIKLSKLVNLYAEMVGRDQPENTRATAREFRRMADILEKSVSEMA